MKDLGRLILAGYAGLLGLYPSDFRLEFGREMQWVFRAAFDEKRKQGRWALLAFCLRELWGLSRSVFAQNWLGLRARFAGKVHAARAMDEPGVIPIQQLPGWGGWYVLIAFPRLRRVFDLLLAGSSLVILAPVLLLVALVVRMDSPGPVFFCQQRRGTKGRRYTLYKFRSMLSEPAFNLGPGRRITRAGGFLRRYHLDEMPQLLNIVKGDVGLIGGVRPPLT